MTTQIIIWGSAFIAYAIFWLWYVGFRKPITKTEIDFYLSELRKFKVTNTEQLNGLRTFLEGDTGKSFAMVNLIQLKEKPDLIDGVIEGDISLKTLIGYHKPFMKMMLKRRGIGIFQGRAAGSGFDLIGINNAKEWSISGINRFRSRRDLMELMIHPTFYEKHALKFAALKKSIAVPIDRWFQVGGVPLTVALIFALIAAGLHILLT
jgi:hypothetical protein